MKFLKSHFILLMLAGFVLFSVAACNSSDSLTQPEEQKLSDHEALLKILDDDEIMQSFEPNYNEEEAMSLLGGSLTKEIYPFRIGQRMRPVDRNLDIVFEGDTAVGKLTITYEGVLHIAASFDPFEFVPGTGPDTSIVDTLIKKEFTSVVTTNVKYAKVRNTPHAERNWKLVAESLPEGGTGSANIKITKLRVEMPGDEFLEITNPGDYFLQKTPGMRRQLPVLNKNEEVSILVELQSAYADTDLVTLTYGAIKGGPQHRVKSRFELVDEQFDGTYYQRTYKQIFTVRNMPGNKHAIINAIPKKVIFDDEAAVEEHSWGVPYKVR